MALPFSILLPHPCDDYSVLLWNFHHISGKSSYCLVFLIGPEKPTKIDAILRGMVDELKRLSSRGFQWLLNGELITSTVDLICVSVVSISRSDSELYLV
jgi:hypothetical protein